MKKLFAIAIAASMLGGLYGFSFGLGVAYDEIGRYDPSDPFISIKADVMCKPLPILGLRIGLVDVDMRSDDQGGTMFNIATGCEATVMLYIPMAGMIQPYIPFYLMYADLGDAGSSKMHLFGGVGAEFGFGSLAGYLEARFAFYDEGEFLTVDPESETWFAVQGGVRIPIGL